MESSRSPKSNSRLEADREKTGHREFPGGPPSKYYPGPTMLNFRDRTGSGVFIVVWTCHDLESFLGVFYLSSLASRKHSKVGKPLSPWCPAGPFGVPGQAPRLPVGPPDLIRVGPHQRNRKQAVRLVPRSSRVRCEPDIEGHRFRPKTAFPAVLRVRAAPTPDLRGWFRWGPRCGTRLAPTEH